MSAARPTRAEATAALEDLYAQLPDIECKGLCHDSCTAVDASELERERIRDRGVDLGPSYTHDRVRKLIASDRTPRCPALSPINTCSVYEVRPLICRLFGTILDRHDPRRSLLCEHGCVPDGVIHPEDATRALIEVEELSRQATGVRRAGWAR